MPHSHAAKRLGTYYNTVVSRTGVGRTGFFVVADDASSNAEFEILAGDRSGTGHLIGSGAGAFDGTGLKRAFFDLEIVRDVANTHVAGRAASRSIENVEVQVQLGRCRLQWRYKKLQYLFRQKQQSSK